MEYPGTGSKPADCASAQSQEKTARLVPFERQKTPASSKAMDMRSWPIRLAISVVALNRATQNIIHRSVAQLKIVTSPP